MHYWSEHQRAPLLAVVESARTGHPSALLVEGAPGTGKTALLDDVTAVAEGFRVLTADGLDIAERLPFDLLDQWGVDLETGPVLRPMVAAQSLRRRLDELARRSPVLLRVDDLQWADPESVEALLWLLRRTAGDRLLLAVASRPLPVDVHGRFWRWLTDQPTTSRIRLTGLNRDDAGRLAADLQPRLPAATVDRLFRHTGGNPLYLSALLAEHEADQLDRVRILPAPAEYAHLTARRVARLTPAAARLLRAMCVMGGGWVSQFRAVAVAGLDGVGDAVAELTAAGLAENQLATDGPIMRPSHALLRSAVYQATPPSQRREMHLAAASLTSDPAGALEHRLAAAQEYDEVLADDLRTYARTLHEARSHRLAADYHRSAAAVTADPVRRRKSALDAVLDTVLGPEPAIGAADETLLRESGDHPDAVVTRATRLVITGEWDRALTELRAGAPGADRVFDPLTEYRFQVLTAWAAIGTGQPDEVVAGALDRAAHLPADPALSGYQESPRLTLLERTRGLDSSLAALGRLADRATDIPGAQTFALAGRGVMRLRAGMLDGAAADLSEVGRRFSEGTIDIADGAYLARLGQVYWWRGEWDRARSTFETAIDVSDRFLQPIVSTTASLLYSTTGDFARADELLDSAREFYARKPWEEGGRALIVAEVVRLHAGSDGRARREYLADRRSAFDRLIRSPANGILEILHAALAFAWAQDESGLRWAAAEIDRLTVKPAWAPAVSDWLASIMPGPAPAGGPDGTEDRRLAEAARRLSDIPLYQAHALAAAADAADRTARPVAAADLRRQADDLYRALGATPYFALPAAPGGLSRAGIEPAVPNVPVPTSPIVKDVWGLSDREREILTLLLNGLSYAQIAQEMFITRSTVAYHLSNIYAKTDVNSRHALTALVRADPRSFGMLSVSA